MIVTMNMTMTKMMTIKHYSQPTGNACGPTCIYMARKAMLGDGDGLEIPILKISEYCGTDWIVGTPPERMEKGFRALNMDYIEYIKPPRPYELLKEIIKENKIPIIRTITKNIPHWIICNGYDEVTYDILDPWLGIIKYTEKQLDEIWKPRDYQFFEVTGWKYYEESEQIKG